MKEAIKDSYWYFYIPLVVLFILPYCAEWVLEAKDKSQENYRHYLISGLACISGIILYFIWYILTYYFI